MNSSIYKTKLIITLNNLIFLNKFSFIVYNVGRTNISIILNYKINNLK